MNIWLMQLGEPIPIREGVRKQRLSLLAEAAVKRGHRVVRWGSAFDHITKTMLFAGDAEVELGPNYLVKFIKGLGYQKNISLRRYLDHALIDQKLVRIAKTLPAPDLILVATPPHGLAYHVVRFARRRRIPVIVDIRDQWPSIFVERLPKKLQKLGPYLFAWEFHKIRHALAGADGVTAMMEDLLLWGLAQGGRGRTAFDRVFYIGTRPAEDHDLSLLPAAVQQLAAAKNGRQIFTFVGTFSNFYNPTIIAEVAGRLHREGREDVVFLLAGSGDHFEAVKSRAANLPNVQLLGWLQHEEIMALLKVTDVGICPLNEFRPCFPNKIFIYLSACLPIISSTPGEFEQLLHSHNLGLYYEPGNSEGLYQAVSTLADNPHLQAAMKNNVSKVFAELFDAEMIYGKFVDHLEYVALSPSRSLAEKGGFPSKSLGTRIREDA